MSSSTSQFGQNQWLVDEMYQKYKQDPSSVDASWHEFLADYTPEATGENNQPATAAQTAATATAVKTAPAPKPATTRTAPAPAAAEAPRPAARTAQPAPAQPAAPAQPVQPA
uniref:2-oxoglutarate dehydrogenase E1 subunit family protein n=1 Tax=Nocardia arizonensis TaxID=1141647 RepID=UPI000A549599